MQGMYVGERRSSRSRSRTTAGGGCFKLDSVNAFKSEWLAVLAPGDGEVVCLQARQVSRSSAFLIESASHNMCREG